MLGCLPETALVGLTGALTPATVIPRGRSCGGVPGDELLPKIGRALELDRTRDREGVDPVAVGAVISPESWRPSRSMPGKPSYSTDVSLLFRFSAAAALPPDGTLHDVH